MPTMQQIPIDSPLMIAWNEYIQTEDYKNTKKWAAYEKHIDGSLWAAFMSGYNKAKEELCQNQF